MLASTSFDVPAPPIPPPELTKSGKPLTKKEKKAVSFSTFPVSSHSVTKHNILQLKNMTAGSDWFDLPAPAEADLPRLYREVEALRLRNQLDPKRFYRKDEGEGKGIKGLPKFFAVSLHTQMPILNYHSSAIYCRLVPSYLLPHPSTQPAQIISPAPSVNARLWMNWWTMLRRSGMPRRSSPIYRASGELEGEGHWRRRIRIRRLSGKKKSWAQVIGGMDNSELANNVRSRNLVLQRIQKYSYEGFFHYSNPQYIYLAYL